MREALQDALDYAANRRAFETGDRRDHFVAETDLWEMLMRISVERKKREIDPTLLVLDEIRSLRAQHGL